MLKSGTILIILFFITLSRQACSQPAEVRWLKQIHADSSGRKDVLFKGLSFSVAPVSVISPASVILTGYIQKNETIKQEGFKQAGALIIATAVGSSLKWIINRPRPFKSYEGIHPKDRVGPYSFPSNHTALAFATATSLSLSFPRWYVVVPAYLWASGAAYSRMYLGVHYPSDVLGGIVVGVGASLLSWQIDKWVRQ